MRSRWFELGWVDKGVSVTGLGLGSLGIGFVAFLTILTLLTSQGGLSLYIGGLAFFAIFSALFLVPFLSALGLLLLPLKNEQRGILSFFSLIASIFAAIPVFFVLSAVYCYTTHAICS